jgi:hypothetical protein
MPYADAWLDLEREMTTDTASRTRAPDYSLDVPPAEPVSSRRELRRQRTRTRQGLIWAIVICAGVPLAVVISLWNNLTEPFWFNEQWRADYISASGNWWAVLKGAGAQGVGAPFTAGWYFLERVSGLLFGSTELALRLPTALFLPVGCVLLLLLARRWMSIAAAVVVALVGTLTTALLVYAVQLAEYQVDAVAAVAVVLLHEIVWDTERPGWRSYGCYAAYAGIAVACTFSLPVVFLAGPLLLLDVARAVRARSIEPRTVGAVGAGLLILAHLAFFVLPQNANDVTNGPFWKGQFLPHHGIGNQLAFVWDGLRGFVTGPFTSYDATSTLGPIGLHGPIWSWSVSIVFGLLLCIGVVVLARARRGRTLLFAIGSSLLLTLVASYLRRWPFGFVRTNFYLVPLLVLVAGIGGYAVFTWARTELRRLRTEERWHAAGWLAALGAAALAVAAAGVVVAGADEVSSYREVRASTAALGYGAEIGKAVAAVRADARPGSAVVVSGLMAVNGWNYYQYEYTGHSTWTGPQIAGSHTVLVIDHGSPLIARLVGRTAPGQVFYYAPVGTTNREIDLDVNRIDSTGDCHRTKTTFFGDSGVMLAFSCSQP